MPVAIKNAKCTRFDGPPRVVAIGFQIKNGMLTGCEDLFDDPAFDESRRTAQIIADYIRKQGPFMPHRLGPEEMEYTTLPQVLEKLKDRFVAVAGEPKAKRPTFKTELLTPVSYTHLTLPTN